MDAQSQLLENRVMTDNIGEFGLSRLREVSEFADKLEHKAASRNTSEPGLRGDLRQAASHLRQMVSLLRSAMGATEEVAVISLDCEGQVVVSTRLRQ
jgi:hypothetical protein